MEDAMVNDDKSPDTAQRPRTGPSRPITKTRHGALASAVLLMRGMARLDAASLERALQETLGRASDDGPRIGRVESRDGLAFGYGALQLTLSGLGHPYDSKALRTARASALGRLLREDWDTRIERHDAALCLTVVLEPVPEAPPSRAVLDTAVALAHVAASHLTAHHAEAVEAVLWSPPAQLFSPRRFLAMADMIDPLPLLLHPVPYPAGDGAPGLGLELRGAEALIGHRLRIAPTEARFGWLAARGFALVAHLRRTGEPLREGDSVSLVPGEALRISRAEDGAMVLTAG